MKKEAVVAYFKVLPRHLPEGTETTTKNLSRYSRSPGRDLKPGPSEYEAGVLPTQPRRLVICCHLCQIYFRQSALSNIPINNQLLKMTAFWDTARCNLVGYK
jgi:hypothetical protein